MVLLRRESLVASRFVTDIGEAEQRFASAKRHSGYDRRGRPGASVVEVSANAPTFAMLRQKIAAKYNRMAHAAAIRTMPTAVTAAL
jgi:hypothetical protein